MVGERGHKRPQMSVEKSMGSRREERDIAPAGQLTVGYGRKLLLRAVVERTEERETKVFREKKVGPGTSLCRLEKNLLAEALRVRVHEMCQRSEIFTVEECNR